MLSPTSSVTDLPSAWPAAVGPSLSPSATPHAVTLFTAIAVDNFGRSFHGRGARRLGNDSRSSRTLGGHPPQASYAGCIHAASNPTFKDGKWGIASNFGRFRYGSSKTFFIFEELVKARDAGRIPAQSR